jgi:hypothetical protein
MDIVDDLYSTSADFWQWKYVFLHDEISTELRQFAFKGMCEPQQVISCDLAQIPIHVNVFQRDSDEDASRSSSSRSTPSSPSSEQSSSSSQASEQSLRDQETLPINRSRLKHDSVLQATLENFGLKDLPEIKPVHRRSRTTTRGYPTERKPYSCELCPASFSR